eukprot:2937885-Lingulodinium_polyedra.AAC.1
MGPQAGCAGQLDQDDAERVVQDVWPHVAESSVFRRAEEATICAESRDYQSEVVRAGAEHG